MKLAIGLPWYAGPDEHTGPHYMDVAMYFGRLAERAQLRKKLIEEENSVEGWLRLKDRLRPVDESGVEEYEPTEEDYDRMGDLEIALIDCSRTSLVGKAREVIVDMALEWNADYLLWWDDDMQLAYSSFIRLFRHDKPVVGALAFTARYPFHPVIYRVAREYDPFMQAEVLTNSDVVFDYPKNQLVGNAELGGELAMGGACVLYNMNVFKEIPKPWFTSYGCGEDFFFCDRCAQFGIERFVDTSVKTRHKAHQPIWIDEGYYWNCRKNDQKGYEEAFGQTFTEVVE